MMTQRTALARAADYDSAPRPDAWTAEHVEVRLVEALTTIMRTTKRPGPKGAGNAHPETVVEFADLATLSFGETLERFMEAVEARAARNATMATMGMVQDEASASRQSQKSMTGTAMSILRRATMLCPSSAPNASSRLLTSPLSLCR